MKRLKFLFAVCAVATVSAFSAFINNCVVIVRWWRSFIAAGGDTVAMKAEISGIVPWLDWSVVDYSAVTTFIPALGLLCMTLSVWRLLRGKRVRREDFPFFKGSDQLNVALGLFGTLWGIIVIGYFRLDTVTMADLMQCLHTALFSTLMAVVWVFMIDRPLVRPLFLKLLDGSNTVETDDGDLADAVDRLIMRLGDASDAFDSRQRRFEKAFSDRQKKADEAFRRQMADLDAFCKRRMEAHEREFELRQKEYVELFRRRIDELQAEAAGARSQAEAAEARLSAVSEALHGKRA